MATIAITGQGASAAEWAARALLMGHDVLCDGIDGLEAELAAARKALPALYDVSLPPEGQLQTTGTPQWSIETDGDHAMLVQDDRALVLGAAAPVWLFPVVASEVPGAFCAALGLGPGDGAEGRALLDLAGGDIDATVSALRALKAKSAGMGAIIATHEARIAPQAPTNLSAPPPTLIRQVPPDWVDYNGHMNEARYLTAFSDATDRMLLWAGMDAECVAQGHSVFTVETHIQHIGEVNIGDRIEVRTQVIDGAGKRLHLFHEMTNQGEIAATAEQLLLHVDLNTRRVALPREDVGNWLDGAGKAHAHLPRPDGFGRHVGAPRK